MDEPYTQQKGEARETFAQSIQRLVSIRSLLTHPKYKKAIYSPARDWVVLLSLSGVFSFGAIIFGIVTYLEFSGGAEVAPGGPPAAVLSKSRLDETLLLLREREEEHESIITSRHTPVDPSR